MVATIGPASETKAILEKMIKAGLNVARLNFSHGNYSHHLKLIKNIRRAAKSQGVKVPIIQDLQGPRIRIGEIKPDGIKVSKGQEIFLAPEGFKPQKTGNRKVFPIHYPDLYRQLKAGESVLINDAKIQLKVKKITGKAVLCRVVIGGVIKSHKGMNFPDSKITCSPITRKDIEDLEFGIKNEVDFVALSFVKDEADILKLKRRIATFEKKHCRNHKKLKNAGSEGVRTRVIAKIERREAIGNFNKILKVADGIMIARGDLGIEIPFEKLPLIQKQIIDKCRKVAKPVIVATQMLDSMIKNPIPTRAEVSDVANAVLDASDAIMLSGESATGKYPLKSVEAMAKIAEELEEREIAEQENNEQAFKNSKSISQLVSFVAQDLAEDISEAKLLISATASGFTARNIASFRAAVPIVAFSPYSRTVNQLSLSWGVEAYLTEFSSSFSLLTTKVKKILLKEKLIKRNEIIVIVAGHPFGRKGQSNFVKVERI